MTAIKNHILLWAMILICIGLVVNFLSIKFLLEKIDSVRCVCHGMKVEASGNHMTVHTSSEDPIQQLAREQLISRGLIKDERPDLPRSVRSEGR